LAQFVCHVKKCATEPSKMGGYSLERFKFNSA
jgi:hypothetical protein